MTRPPVVLAFPSLPLPSPEMRKKIGTTPKSSTTQPCSLAIFFSSPPLFSPRKVDHAEWQRHHACRLIFSFFFFFPFPINAAVTLILLDRISLAVPVVFARLFFPPPPFLFPPRAVVNSAWKAWSPVCCGAYFFLFPPPLFPSFFFSTAGRKEGRWKGVCAFPRFPPPFFSSFLWGEVGSISASVHLACFISPSFPPFFSLPIGFVAAR